MATISLEPLATAVMTVLQNAALQAATPGGWWSGMPRNATYPCGWYELSLENAGGLGTHQMRTVDLRLHVFTQAQGVLEGQRIAALAEALFTDQPLTLSGVTMCDAVVYDDTEVLPPIEMLGLPVVEVVSFFHFFVEES